MRRPLRPDARAPWVLTDGKPGLIDVSFEVDGDPFPPYEQHAYLLQKDGSVLRQIRTRDCGMQTFCEDGPWRAWGPHELCEASDSFHPDNYSACMAVPDWTCAEVVAAATP